MLYNRKKYLLKRTPKMFAFMFKSLKAVVMTLGVLTLISIVLSIGVNAALSAGLLEETTKTVTDVPPHTVF
jgi:hypothetical protein